MNSTTLIDRLIGSYLQAVRVSATGIAMDLQNDEYGSHLILSTSATIINSGSPSDFIETAYMLLTRHLEKQLTTFEFSEDQATMTLGWDNGDIELVDYTTGSDNLFILKDCETDEWMLA